MREKINVICIALALLMLVISAQAATVIVSPSNMRGWSIATYNLGYGEICTWGPPPYENNSSVPFVAGPKGAFFAETDLYKGTAPASGDINPSCVWLGTDTYNGAPVAGKTLGSITAMNYYSWVASSPMRDGDGPVNTEEFYWRKTDFWRYAQQPMYLQLTFESPDGLEKRQVWCMPWGYNVVGDDFPKAHLNKWELINCMQLKWYMPQSEDLAQDPDAYEMVFNTWTDVLNHQLPGDGITPLPPFRDWKLIATNEAPWPEGAKGNGWTGSCDPAGHPVKSNGTGKAINFFMGARISKTRVFAQGGDILWAGKGNGFRGCIDYFTLGFDGVNETYNFEPASTTPAVTVVATTIKSCGDQIMGYTMAQNTTSSFKGTQRMKMFKLTGKVNLINNGAGKNDWFRFDDFSGLTYTEKWKDGTGNFVTDVQPAYAYIFIDPPTAGDPRIGDWISAYGYVETFRFAPANTPPILWTCPLHINWHVEAP